MTCKGCKATISPLAEFPGRLCLECYRPQGEALAKTMTAERLTEMWGGKVRHPERR